MCSSTLINVADDTSVRILNVLNAEQRAALEALGGPVEFPSGHAIFLEGAPSHSVLLIKDGHLKVTRRAADDTEIILAIRGADELMGEEGVLMEEPRAATVTAITPVTGRAIAAADLLRFVEENGLWPLMYRAAVRRRRQADQLLLQARLGVKSRLARWLLDLAVEVGEPVGDGVVIESTLSQLDFAGRVGASREAVSVALRNLRQAGLVSTARHRIVLHDLDGLRKLAINPQIGDAS
jgi:CRP-like cAMP-binding protein